MNRRVGWLGQDDRLVFGERQRETGQRPKRANDGSNDHENLDQRAPRRAHRPQYRDVTGRLSARRFLTTMQTERSSPDAPQLLTFFQLLSWRADWP